HTDPRLIRSHLVYGGRRRWDIQPGRQLLTWRHHRPARRREHVWGQFRDQRWILAGRESSVPTSSYIHSYGYADRNTDRNGNSNPDSGGAGWACDLAGEAGSAKRAAAVTYHAHTEVRDYRGQLRKPEYQLVRFLYSQCKHACEWHLQLAGERSQVPGEL